MPELPEVETVRRGLEPAMQGQRLEAAVARRPNLRFPFPDGFGQRLTGRTVIGIRRRAKFLIFDLDGPDVLIAHLGMSGSFRIGTEPFPEEKHDHVIFRMSGGGEIHFNDPRRFGFMDIWPADGLGAYPMLARLGPEPLDDEAFNGTVLAARLKCRKTPIKSALLDQGVVSGVGNIYACEALFRAGISPKRSAHTVQGARAEKLAQSVKDVLKAAIESGGSSLRDHIRPDGELGYFQHNFDVYGRTGETCRYAGCDAPVRQIAQAGRSTFYCSRCQR